MKESDKKKNPSGVELSAEAPKRGGLFIKTCKFCGNLVMIVVTLQINFRTYPVQINVADFHRTSGFVLVYEDLETWQTTVDRIMQ